MSGPLMTRVLRSVLRSSMRLCQSGARSRRWRRSTRSFLCRWISPTPTARYIASFSSSSSSLKLGLGGNLESSTSLRFIISWDPRRRREPPRREENDEAAEVVLVLTFLEPLPLPETEDDTENRFFLAALISEELFFISVTSDEEDEGFLIYRSSLPLLFAAASATLFMLALAPLEEETDPLRLPLSRPAADFPPLSVEAVFDDASLLVEIGAEYLALLGSFV